MEYNTGDHINDEISTRGNEITLSPDQHSLASSLLRSLLYFDVFSYPLTREEWLSYCDFPSPSDKLSGFAIDWLLSVNFVKFESGFFYVGEDNTKIRRRIAGNELAKKRRRDAKRYSRLIASFPFSRGVFISGSLSKNYMDKESDIDYFIITKPGRLWLNRTLLVLFKRIFLLNSHKNFCINYVVDSENLEIPDHNIYAATETALLLPFYNYELFSRFLEINDWYRRYFPNIKIDSNGKEFKISKLKSFLEAILSNRFGDLVEELCFKLNTSFWKRKYREMEPEKFTRNFTSTKSVSRYHPDRQQFKVLDALDERIRKFESETGFVIHELNLTYQST